MPIRIITKSILILIVTCFSGFYSCTNTGPSESENQQLAEIYCSGCHQFPDPKLLDKQTWKENVLPRMALRLGYLPQNVSSEKFQSDYFLLSDNDLFPAKPLIDQQIWQKINDYYLSLAPDSLETVRPTISKNQLFQLRIPDIKTGLLPSATLIKHVDHHGTLVASFANKKLWIVNGSEKPGAVDLIPKIVSNIEVLDQSRLLVTFLGDVIRPDAPARGLVATFEMDGQQLIKATPLPLPPLYRPTQAFFTQLNNTPDKELVISQFGFYQGRLSYWENEGNKFVEKMIRNEPGAIKVETDDFNGDGQMDLMALFAHGNERISMFLNQGDGTFREKMILQFPAVYGSSNFILKDMDGDHKKDIVYTCGDNADISPIPKPYHGVYVFANQDDATFEEKYFHPLDGAYQVVAEDFDLDGDQDLAAVGFFVNDQNPRGFLFLTQTEKLAFLPSTLDLDQYGRWIGLTSADVDEDGDQDIMLGNGYGLSGIDFMGELKEKSAPPWILLENKTVYSESTTKKGI